MRDVYVFASIYVLQTYRIENNRVFNFRCLNYRDLDEHTIYRDLDTAHEAIRQLSSMMQQEDQLRQPLPENNPRVTVVNMNISSPIYSTPFPSGYIAWYDWRVCGWTGTPEDAPEIIRILCQNAMQVTSLPSQSCADDYEILSPSTERSALSLPDIKNYPSYLRAVPLFTEKELGAEKDTPLIDSAKTRKNVHYAVQYPYTLFPIPPGRSPFPTVLNYTPGNKFKVSDEGGLFLIETFVNGNLGENTQK